MNENEDRMRLADNKSIYNAWVFCNLQSSSECGDMPDKSRRLLLVCFSCLSFVMSDDGKFIESCSEIGSTYSFDFIENQHRTEFAKISSLKARNPIELLIALELRGLVEYF